MTRHIVRGSGKGTSEESIKKREYFTSADIVYSIIIVGNRFDLCECLLYLPQNNALQLYLLSPFSKYSSIDLQLKHP